MDNSIKDPKNQNFAVRMQNIYESFIIFFSSWNAKSNLPTNEEKKKLKKIFGNLVLWVTPYMSPRLFNKLKMAIKKDFDGSNMEWLIVEILNQLRPYITKFLKMGGNFKFSGEFTNG